ncbi:hypothethical protein [Ralstonia solanacearum PSI07]|nr:hypothethical protein [Ralstonia solanacearum PSI07]
MSGEEYVCGLEDGCCAADAMALSVTRRPCHCHTPPARSGHPANVGGRPCWTATLSQAADYRVLRKRVCNANLRQRAQGPRR